MVHVTLHADDLKLARSKVTFLTQENTSLQGKTVSLVPGLISHVCNATNGQISKK